MCVCVCAQALKNGSKYDDIWIYKYEQTRYSGDDFILNKIILTQLPKMIGEKVESALANIMFYKLDLDIRKLVRRLERLYLKILKWKQYVVFNQTCLDNNLLIIIYMYIYIYIYIY